MWSDWGLLFSWFIWSWLIDWLIWKKKDGRLFKIIYCVFSTWKPHRARGFFYLILIFLSKKMLFFQFGFKRIFSIIFYELPKTNCCSYTVVGDKINTTKTTFELNFELLNSMDTHKHWSQLRSCQKSFSTIACKLVIRKKLVSSQNLNKKVVFTVLI